MINKNQIRDLLATLGSFITAVVTNGSLSGSGTDASPLSALPTTYSKPSTGTLTVAEMSGTIVNNIGQTVENTQTTPAVFAGLNTIFQISVAGVGQFHIKPAPGYRVHLNGIALAVNNKISNVIPVVGDMITMIAFETSPGVFNVIARTSVGTWIDGGA